MRRRHLRQTVTPASAAVDWTPLIDIVFLLLIFFILTTTFKPDIVMLGALMPAQGQATAPPRDIPLPTVRISVVPAGIDLHADEATYERWAQEVRRNPIDTVAVRMGGQLLTTIDLRLLRRGEESAQTAELMRVHAIIHAGLAAREDGSGGPRAQAPPIEIHAWSGLPWASVTTVFDAVRAYESAAHGTVITEQAHLRNARPLAFAPPRIRNTVREDGRELYEIVRLR